MNTKYVLQYMCPTLKQWRRDMTDQWHYDSFSTALYRAKQNEYQTRIVEQTWQGQGLNAELLREVIISVFQYEIVFPQNIIVGNLAGGSK